jgi:hypothetical protein
MSTSSRQKHRVDAAKTARARSSRVCERSKSNDNHAEAAWPLLIRRDDPQGRGDKTPSFRAGSRNPGARNGNGRKNKGASAVAERFRSRVSILPWKHAKTRQLILKILGGISDANIGFGELCDLRIRLGFEQRIRGGHHLFKREGVEEKINLQSDNGKAKPYQVKQVRSILIR